MKNELKSKLEEVANELNMTVDNILEECYRAKEKQYIKEDIVWCLEQFYDNMYSSDEDIDAIWDNYDQDVDCEISHWDNIKNAIDKYISGLKVSGEDEDESKFEEAKREYYNNVIAPQIGSINRR